MPVPRDVRVEHGAEHGAVRGAGAVSRGELLQRGELGDERPDVPERPDRTLEPGQLRLQAQDDRRSLAGRGVSQVPAALRDDARYSDLTVDQEEVMHEALPALRSRVGNERELAVAGGLRP